MAEFEECKKRMEKREQLEKLYYAGFLPAYIDYTFESFEVSAGNRENFEACKNYVDNPQNLFIHGPCGNGKTRLAVTALLKRKVEKGAVVKVISWELFKNSVLNDMRENRHNGFIKKLANYNDVLLDDIFRNSVNETTKAAFIEFLELAEGYKQPNFIITFNKDWGALTAILEDDRAISRLSGLLSMGPIKNSAEDFRVKNLEEKIIKAGQDFQAKAAELGL